MISSSLLNHQRKQVYFSDQIGKHGQSGTLQAGGSMIIGSSKASMIPMARTTQVIGSIHAQRVNYPKDQIVFHATDVAQKSIKARNDIKRLIDPDTLGLHRQQWNSTVFKQRLIREPSSTIGPNLSNTLLLIKSGLADQRTVDLKDKRIEVGVDTRNDYTGWNVSTESESMKHKTLRTYQQNKQLVEHTKQFANKLLRQKSTKVEAYKGPLQKQKQLNRQYRKQKQNQEDLMQKAKAQVKIEDPDASNAKLVAKARKKVQEMINRAKPLQKDCTFKPDLRVTCGIGNSKKTRWNLISF